MTPTAAEGAPLAVPFTMASRAQSRFSATQTVSNLTSGGSFQPIQLPATGWVRCVEIEIDATYTTSGSAAVVAGDAPLNLVSDITLTDSAGTPIVQPSSGYNLYLSNKYLDLIDVRATAGYGFSASGTSGTATFRLFLVAEQDPMTGYGCIPNLDSNASLQLRLNYAAITAAFTGGTASAGSISVRINQHYWAPVGPTGANGLAASAAPPGQGDYVETRYETQTVTASAENIIQVVNRGGLVKGLVLVSRAAGTRTAFTPGSQVGLRLDNQPIQEGIRLQSHDDKVRRLTGYVGATATTSYAPITAGTVTGLDSGVLAFPLFKENGGYMSRDSWLNTKVGSLLQVIATPGASATSMEIITQLAQVKQASAFYSRAR